MKIEIKDTFKFDIFPKFKLWMTSFQNNTFRWGIAIGIFIGIFIGTVLSGMFSNLNDILFGTKYLTILGLIAIVCALFAYIIGKSRVAWESLVGKKMLNAVEKVIDDEPVE